MFSANAFDNGNALVHFTGIWEGYRMKDICKPEAAPITVVPMKLERMARFTTARGYGVGVLVKENPKTVKLRLKGGKEITVSRRKKAVEIFGPMVVLKPFNRKGR